MNAFTRQQFLEQIAAIPTMERGKLSTYSFQDRPGLSGPYHKLQHWQDGKNQTRYVPADQVSAVEAALAGYAQYEQLTRQYADLVIAETRQNLAASKKKTSRPSSASPKRRKWQGSVPHIAI
jgi:hypothetical protein